MHWDGHGTILRDDDIRYIEKLLFSSVEGYEYIARLSLVVNQCYSLSGDELLCYDLCDISWIQPFDEPYFFEKLPHSPKDITVER